MKLYPKMQACFESIFFRTLALVGTIVGGYFLLSECRYYLPPFHRFEYGALAWGMGVCTVHCILLLLLSRWFSQRNARWLSLLVIAPVVCYGAVGMMEMFRLITYFYIERDYFETVCMFFFFLFVLVPCGRIFVAFSIPSNLPGLVPLVLLYVLLSIQLQAFQWFAEAFEGTWSAFLAAMLLLSLWWTLFLPGLLFPMHRQWKEYWCPAALPRLEKPKNMNARN